MVRVRGMPPKREMFGAEGVGVARTDVRASHQPAKRREGLGSMPMSEANQYSPRKVRAPQETVVGNAHPAQAER